MEKFSECKTLHPEPIVVEAEDGLACNYLAEIGSLLDYEEKRWLLLPRTDALNVIRDARDLTFRLGAFFQSPPPGRYHEMVSCVRDCDFTCIPRSFRTKKDASAEDKQYAVMRRNIAVNYMISFLQTMDKCMRDAVVEGMPDADLPPFKDKWEQLEGYDTALEIVDPESSDKPSDK